mgnify:CR=1 FL=1
MEIIKQLRITYFLIPNNYTKRLCYIQKIGKVIVACKCTNSLGPKQSLQI